MLYYAKGNDMRYIGAIFDQDGLLFDTERIYQSSWVEAGGLHGIAVHPDFPKRFCGLSPSAITAIVREAYPQLDVDAYCRDAMRMAWEAQLAQTPEPKKGLLEMLEFCRSHGIRTAIASSSTISVVRHNIESAGVADFFDAIATDGEVKHGKPAPDIFLLAASKIGVDPALCVVFEDAFSGIRGASAAGCRPVMIPDMVQPTDEIRAICTIYPDLAAATAAFE